MEKKKLNHQPSLAERYREAVRAFRGKGYGIGGKADCYYDPSNPSLLFGQPKNTGQRFAARRWLRRRIRALQGLIGYDRHDEYAAKIAAMKRRYAQEASSEQAADKSTDL